MLTYNAPAFMSTTSVEATEPFRYEEGMLSVAGVSLDAIAGAVPTPFYVYSVEHLVARYRALEAAFGGVPHLHCVALKANAQPALLRALVEEGAGAEVVSGAELALALALGFAPSLIVFSGVGKTDSELRAGLTAGIRMFLVESETELRTLDGLASELGRRARVALRLNPDIDPKTHPHIATGVSTAKFGVDPEQAGSIFSRHADFPNIDFAGVHSHIGSQISSVEPLAANARALAQWTRSTRELGVTLRYVDVGGGLGIDYEGGGRAPLFRDYAKVVTDAFRDLDVEILTEPGRALFGPVGAFVARVLYVKRVHGRPFVVLDAGMNDLLRPALYGAYHRVVQVLRRGTQAGGVEPLVCDITGAVCESSDVFARERPLVSPERGELLAILDTGAYGYVMSSNYNLRPRPAEVVVENGWFRIVRAAETDEELVARELGAER
jgi:diaminopimelate decarboxylase